VAFEPSAPHHGRGRPFHGRDRVRGRHQFRRLLLRREKRRQRRRRQRERRQQRAVPADRRRRRGGRSQQRCRHSGRQLGSPLKALTTALRAFKACKALNRLKRH